MDLVGSLTSDAFDARSGVVNRLRLRCSRPDAQGKLNRDDRVRSSVKVVDERMLLAVGRPD